MSRWLGMILEVNVLSLRYKWGCWVGLRKRQTCRISSFEYYHRKLFLEVTNLSMEDTCKQSKQCFDRNEEGWMSSSNYGLWLIQRNRVWYLLCSSEIAVSSWYSCRLVQWNEFCDSRLMGVLWVDNFFISWRFRFLNWNHYAFSFPMLHFITMSVYRNLHKLVFCLLQDSSHKVMLCNVRPVMNSSILHITIFIIINFNVFKNQWKKASLEYTGWDVPRKRERRKNKKRFL